MTDNARQIYASLQSGRSTSDVVCAAPDASTSTRSRSRITDALTLRRVTPAAFALADHAWLSVVNLLIALALIRTGQKQEYGLYVLLLSVIYLFHGIQNALFLSPLATVLPRTAEHQQGQVASGSYAFQAVFGVACFGLCLSGLLISGLLWPDSGVTNSLALACCAALVGSIAREGVRATEYAQRNAGRAFVGDLIYGVLGLTLIAYFFMSSNLTASSALWTIGAAGVLPTLFAVVRKGLRPFQKPRELWREFWACGRWALIGVCLSWLSLNSYSYVASWMLGLEAVADLNAARLLIMPAALGIAAWSAFFRPKFAAWYATGGHQNLARISQRSIYCGLFVLLSFAYALHALFPVVEFLFGPQYQHLEPLVLLWTVFFAFSLARTVYMGSLMVDAEGYRSLTGVAAIGLATMLPLIAMGAHEGTAGILAALIAVEAMQALLVRKRARRYWIVPA